MVDTVYKVMREHEWKETIKTGGFWGSVDDRRDGFIHLSTKAQLRGTLDKHFAGIHGLVLLSLDALQFGEALKWEPARGGALFPHLYGTLPLSAVKEHTVLTRDAEGRHLLPPDISR